MSDCSTSFVIGSGARSRFCASGRGSARTILRMNEALCYRRRIRFLDTAGRVANFALEMKRDNLAGHLVIAFVIALAVYVLAYRGIEGRRTRQGPWEITFTNSPDGHPEIVVDQSR